MAFRGVLASSAQKHYTVYALLRIKHLAGFAGDYLCLMSFYLYQHKLSLCRQNFQFNKQIGKKKNGLTEADWHRHCFKHGIVWNNDSARMGHTCLPTIEDVNSQGFQQTEAFPSVLPTEAVQHNVHSFWRNPEAAKAVK